MAVLETCVTAKTRENMKKSAKSDRKQLKKVLLVSQELKLARALAGNNKTMRDRALKSLKKWFQNRSTTIPFSEEDFMRLWKGIFYSMWMSDKPLIQEECAESIAHLVHYLPVDSALLFYKCGTVILLNEWFGIDQLRLDKFLMFVRRLLRQILFVLKKEEWNKEYVKKFTRLLSETILDVNNKQRPVGLLLHFSEIYLEEIAKVSEGELPPQFLTEFLQPFIKQLAFSDDARILDHLRKHIFVHLIRQSDLGLEYEEKYQAWRSLGFPGSIDSMKKVEENGEEAAESEGEDEEEEGETETVLDPRAGHVNVELPQLKFHSRAISKALEAYKFNKNTNVQSRRLLNELSEHFKKMASKIYPLGVKRVKLAKDDYDTNIRKAVNRLVKFDRKIKGEKRKKSNEEEIELRNGKKIKLDQKVQEDLVMSMKRDLKRKRKLDSFIEKSDKKFLKKLKRNSSKSNSNLVDESAGSNVDEENSSEIESIFKRNSGTWLVTLKPEYKKEENSTTAGEMFAEENKWDWEPRNGSETIEKSLKNEVKLVNTKLVMTKTTKSCLKREKNTSNSSTSPKKVKININLNRSQDVHEHHAQILSSPAIPYDAARKPSKPLLKQATLTSPINPFYGSVL